MPTYLASQQVLGHGGHIRRGHWEHLLSLEKSYQKITRKYNNLCIAIESLPHIWCTVSANQLLCGMNFRYAALAVRNPLVKLPFRPFMAVRRGERW